MKKSAIALLVCAGLLSACSSTSSTAIQPGGLEVSGRTVFETLPPQQVRPSQCPMVLFARADETRRIFVSLDNPPMALVRIDGSTRQFSRATTSGAASHRHHEEESYTTPDGAALTASVRFSPLPDESDGAAIRAASLSYTSPEGETAIIPAVGLVSCPDAG